MNDPNASRADVLRRLESYYDRAPRPTAHVEQVGPLTLFVSTGEFPYYARPLLGLARPVSSKDVIDVRRRQRELGVPEALEWVDETTPSLLPAARAAGLAVQVCPLLVLDPARLRDAPDPRIHQVDAGDTDLVLVRAAIDVAFQHEGTDAGDAGIAARDAHRARHPDLGDSLAARVASGDSVLFGAFDVDDRRERTATPVGGGSHNPRGQVSEIVGVGVLPAYRRRGLAGALATALARDALARGVATVFCSAQDEKVASIYLAAGFTRVGTACIAEPPAAPQGPPPPTPSTPTPPSQPPSSPPPSTTSEARP